jgi:hypothetical protein
MIKKVVRVVLLGAAVYGLWIAGSKVSQKMKLKKSGGDPKSVKWFV